MKFVKSALLITAGLIPGLILGVGGTAYYFLNQEPVVLIKQEKGIIRRMIQGDGVTLIGMEGQVPLLPALQQLGPQPEFLAGPGIGSTRTVYTDADVSISIYTDSTGKADSAALFFRLKERKPLPIAPAK